MKKGKLAVCMACLSCLTGCANMEKLPVSVYDSNVETILDVREGTTVRNVLKKAEIVLDDGDTVSPSLSTAITESETDIIIKRCDTAQHNNTETDINETDDMARNTNTMTDTDSINLNTDSTPEEEKATIQPEKQTTTEEETSEKTEPEIVSKEKIYDCDGSGHGYYLIKWSDGREEYEDF